MYMYSHVYGADLMLHIYLQMLVVQPFGIQSQLNWCLHVHVHVHTSDVYMYMYIQVMFTCTSTYKCMYNLIFEKGHFLTNIHVPSIAPHSGILYKKSMKFGIHEELLLSFL